MKLATPVRVFALICVAVTSVFVMVMSYRLIQTLSGPGWCKTALGAEKASSTNGTVTGLDSCVGLLTIQLKSLATNSYIFGGVIALCLLTLIVIVIAGGKLDLSLPEKLGGGGVHLGRQTPEAKAAKQTADAAVDEAQNIAERGAVGTNGEDG